MQISIQSWQYFSFILLVVSNSERWEKLDLFNHIENSIKSQLKRWLDDEGFDHPSNHWCLILTHWTLKLSRLFWTFNSLKFSSWLWEFQNCLAFSHSIYFLTPSNYYFLFLPLSHLIIFYLELFSAFLLVHFFFFYCSFLYPGLETWFEQVLFCFSIPT